MEMHNMKIGTSPASIWAPILRDRAVYRPGRLGSRTSCRHLYLGLVRDKLIFLGERFYFQNLASAGFRGEPCFYFRR
jgi:hypothetical protein